MPGHIRRARLLAASACRSGCQSHRMKPAGKQRLDQLLVDRGLVESRQKGQALILAGSVLVNKQKVDKPGHSVAIDADIELLGSMPFVSRGGFKLDAALTAFGIDMTGKVG